MFRTESSGFPGKEPRNPGECLHRGRAICRSGIRNTRRNPLKERIELLSNREHRKNDCHRNQADHHSVFHRCCALFIFHKFTNTAVEIFHTFFRVELKKARYFSPPNRAPPQRYQSTKQWLNTAFAACIEGVQSPCDRVSELSLGTLRMSVIRLSFSPRPKCEKCGLAMNLRAF